MIYLKKLVLFHFLLKPSQDGVDSEYLAKPYQLNENLAIIPGRLTMHMFEDKISKVWSEVYRGEPSNSHY